MLVLKSTGKLLRSVTKRSVLSSLVDHAGRVRCLSSNVGLAKLTAKGEPQYQTHPKVKSRRGLSKISPLEQLIKAP